MGSITPDFEYFIRMKVDSVYSHTILGMFWFDLPLGLILAFIFHEIVRDPFISNLPKWFGIRLNDFTDFDWKKHFLKNWIVVLISLLIGIASHLFWDSFTHSNGYFVLHFPSLATEITIVDFPIPIYHMLQHGSSLIGAMIILYAIKLLPENKNVVPKPKMGYWIFSFMIMLLVIGIGKFFAQDYLMYGQLFITGISGGMIGLIVMSAVWKIKSRKNISN